MRSTRSSSTTFVPCSLPSSRRCAPATSRRSTSSSSPRAQPSRSMRSVTTRRSSARALVWLPFGKHRLSRGRGLRSNAASRSTRHHARRSASQSRSIEPAERATSSRNRSQPPPPPTVIKPPCRHRRRSEAGVAPSKVPAIRRDLGRPSRGIVFAIVGYDNARTTQRPLALRGVDRRLQTTTNPPSRHWNAVTISRRGRRRDRAAASGLSLVRATFHTHRVEVAAASAARRRASAAAGELADERPSASRVRAAARRRAA